METRPMCYQDIRQALQDRINQGILGTGTKLPSERVLSDDFQTTRTTIREALSSLEQDGIIYREDRRGWFVSPPRLIYNPTVNASFHTMVSEQGATPATQLIGAELIVPPRHIQQQLQLSNDVPTYRIQRLRSINQRVVLYVEHYIRANIFPDLLQWDLTQPLSDIYQNHYQTNYNNVAFELYPITLPDQAATLLRVSKRSAGLLINRINTDQHNRIIDCDFEYWRHDAIVVKAQTN